MFNSFLLAIGAVSIVVLDKVLSLSAMFASLFGPFQNLNPMHFHFPLIG